MISVITCTYNTQHDVLAQTWASLKAQTLTDWESDETSGFQPPTPLLFEE